MTVIEAAQRLYGAAAPPVIGLFGAISVGIPPDEEVAFRLGHCEEIAQHIKMRRTRQGFQLVQRLSHVTGDVNGVQRRGIAGGNLGLPRRGFSPRILPIDTVQAVLADKGVRPLYLPLPAEDANNVAGRARQFKMMDGVATESESDFCEPGELRQIVGNLQDIPRSTYGFR